MKMGALWWPEGAKGCDHGRHGSIRVPEGGQERPSNPASVEHLLAEAGEICFLPLNSAEDGGSYLLETRQFLQIGPIASGVIAEHADALFFVREVTELLEA